ncbi:MAG: type II secretion system F family protein [Candidatus Diapherotrites archaeon]|nr:type II secretion system F family protein [Candidatus Diapherotrites archaeon]
MAKVIPFAPMPVGVLKRMSAPFMRYGAGFSKIMPGLKNKLESAGIDVDEREYGAIMVFLTIFYFAFFTLLFSMVFIRIGPIESLPKELQTGAGPIILGVIGGIVMGMMMFVQMIMYPTMLVRKKGRDLERNLVFALRATLVQLKSGVSLFDCMNTVAKGNYGAVSSEFGRAVDKMNTGTPVDETLEQMAERNPSHFFRKALWQMVNGMKAGADVSSVMSETVASMLREQKIAISRYGSQLKLLSLMYMMIGVIMPALGLTFLIVLGSFPQIKIDEMMFWALLALITVMQFMYVGIIKSRRPNIIG